jgi:hypothetical protein
MSANDDLRNMSKDEIAAIYGDRLTQACEELQQRRLLAEIEALRRALGPPHIVRVRPD